MTIGVFEVQATAAITVVDGSALGLARICPVRQVLFADTAKGSVELFLTNQKRVMLRSDLPAGLGEVQRDAIVGLYYEKPPKPGSRRQAKNPAEERG